LQGVIPEEINVARIVNKDKLPRPGKDKDTSYFTERNMDIFLAEFGKTKFVDFLCHRCGVGFTVDLPIKSFPVLKDVKGHTLKIFRGNVRGYCPAHGGVLEYSEKLAEDIVVESKHI
jgi:hypothetical protein